MQRDFKIFWKLLHATQSTIVGDNLQGWLDFILSYFLLAWGEVCCFAGLFNLQLSLLDNNGPLPCLALLYIMSNDKTNQNSRKKYTGLLKNWDLSVWGMNAMVIYFFGIGSTLESHFLALKATKIDITLKFWLVSENINIQI